MCIISIKMLESMGKEANAFVLLTESPGNILCSHRCRWLILALLISDQR